MFLSELSSYPRTPPGTDGIAVFVILVFVVGLALGQVGAFMWAWNGRPDVVRPMLERLRQRVATRSQVTTATQPNE